MRDLKELLLSDKTKRLLVVMPHPDDETIPIGGLLLTAKQLQYQTHVCILTKGEQGRIHVAGKGRSIKAIRVSELKRAAGILGVDGFEVEDMGDGKLRAQQDACERFVESKIRAVKPSIVVTYDHSGITGHPDHITLSLAVFSVLRSFPRASRPILLWPTLHGKFKTKLLHRDVWQIVPKAQYVLPLGTNLPRKYLSAMAHASQMRHLWWKILILLIGEPNEYYYVADLQKDYKHKYVDFNLGESEEKL